MFWKLFFFILFLLLLSFFFGFLPILHRIRMNRKEKILCIGDSNTYGFGHFFQYYRNYPIYLEIRLNHNFQVLNYGWNGSTILEGPRCNFRKIFPEIANMKPHLIILMLGSNDSKTRIWTNAEEFRACYRNYLQQLFLLTNQIVLITPPYLFTKHSIYDHDFEILKQIREIVFDLANEFQLPCLDFYLESQKHPEWFLNDHVHLNMKGSKALVEFFMQQNGNLFF